MGNIFIEFIVKLILGKLFTKLINLFFEYFKKIIENKELLRYKEEQEIKMNENFLLTMQAVEFAIMAKSQAAGL